jgi:hypothetical protein
MSQSEGQARRIGHIGEPYDENPWTAWCYSMSFINVLEQQVTFRGIIYNW